MKHLNEFLNEASKMDRKTFNAAVIEIIQQLPKNIIKTKTQFNNLKRELEDIYDSGDINTREDIDDNIEFILGNHIVRQKVLNESLNEAEKWNKEPIETNYWTIVQEEKDSFTANNPAILFTKAYEDAVHAYWKTNKNQGYFFGKANATFKNQLWELLSKLQPFDESSSHGIERPHPRGVRFWPKRGKTNELVEFLTKWGNREHIKPRKKKRKKRTPRKK